LGVYYYYVFFVTCGQISLKGSRVVKVQSLVVFPGLPHQTQQPKLTIKDYENTLNGDLRKQLAQVPETRHVPKLTLLNDGL
jgi:hypothetical protein